MNTILFFLLGREPRPLGGLAPLSVFIFSLLLSNLFASQAEFKVLKELEATEKAEPIQAIERRKVEYRAEDLGDPFQEPIREVSVSETETSEVPEAPDLTVQGLIWGGAFPQAIINNKVVRVGDTIEGARVISINKDGVSVSFEGRQYNLSTSLAKPSTKP